jgi:copper chaperone CopZ
MSSAAVADEVPPVGVERLELAVEGMTCAACAAQVAKKLNEIAGVTANVNFATGIASVKAPRQVTLGALIEAVGRAGYRTQPTRRPGAAMAASSAFVVASSLRLRRFAGTSQPEAAALGGYGPGASDRSPTGHRLGQALVGSARTEEASSCPG